MRKSGTFLIILAASLGAAMAAAEQNAPLEDSVVEAANKVDRRQGSSSREGQLSTEHLDLAIIKRPMPKGRRAAKLFEPKSWYVPPPAPTYVPPPQPAAPPLQVVFIGRMVDGSCVTLFLSRNGRQYAVKEGDMLDDTYRVDKIGEIDAILTYMPTNTQQTLFFNISATGNALINASDMKSVMLPAASN